MEDDNAPTSDLHDHGIDIVDERSSASPAEWGPGKTPRGRARLLSSRRRTKPQRSCNLCRQRKLRCDRQHPCTNCTRRELGDSCTYPGENETGTTVRARKHLVSVQDRVQHLEKLLMDMVHGQHSQQSPQGITPRQAPPRLSTTPDPPPSFPHLSGGSNGSNGCPVENVVDMASPPASDCGTMHRTPSGTSYVSSAHWAAVLDDIAVLKMHFEKDEQAQTACPLLEPPPPSRGGPQMLYGCTQLATREELLSSIPARPVVDQLVSGYFSSFEISPAFLHSLQFLKEYEEFWDHPTTTPVIWLGRLFAIMCLATQFQRYKLDSGTVSSGISPAEQDRQLQRSAETLRTKVVQCLVLADYIKGGPGVIETLMLYFSTELFFHQDAEVGVWVLLGTIIQLAMRMGYHREPRHFPSVTPFASEMQRRVWATIVESDIALAMQMGLPRIIHPSQTDTDEPLNLEDCDFDTSTTEMPPSRPEIDQTPMLFRLVKARLFRVVGCIWDLTIRNRPSTYAEAAEMDVELQQAYASIPECFKWRSKTQCMADSPQAVVQKVALQVIYHVARIILRRKYFSSSTRNIHLQHRRHSQQECLDASLKLLDFQFILHEKMRPFGQLYHERWKVYSLVNHIFLLAASILCFYLQRDRGDDADGAAGNDTSMEETIRASLRQSRDIWVHSSSFSKEAQKAARAVSIVLGTEKSPDDEDQDANRVKAGVGIATTPSFSPSASAASSDFMGIANFRPSMNDWTEMGVPFSALNSTTWENWSTTVAGMVQGANLTSPGPTPSITNEGTQKAIDAAVDPSNGMCIQPLVWTG